MGMQNLHKKIRALRKQKGLTLEAVAKKLGMTKGNLSRLERGEVSLSEERSRALAALFDVSVEDLQGVKVDEDHELPLKKALMQKQQQIERMQKATEDFMYGFLYVIANRIMDKNLGYEMKHASPLAQRRLFGMPGIRHLFNGENIKTDSDLYSAYQQYKAAVEEERRIQAMMSLEKPEDTK